MSEISYLCDHDDKFWLYSNNSYFSMDEQLIAISDRYKLNITEIEDFLIEKYNGIKCDYINNFDRYGIYFNSKDDVKEALEWINSLIILESLRS